MDVSAPAGYVETSPAREVRQEVSCRVRHSVNSPSGVRHFGPNRPARVGREPVFQVSQNSPNLLGGFGTQLWDIRWAASVHVTTTGPEVSQ